MRVIDNIYCIKYLVFIYYLLFQEERPQSLSIMLLSTTEAKNMCFVMRTVEVICPLNSSKKRAVLHFTFTVKEIGNYTTEANTIV